MTQITTDEVELDKMRAETLKLNEETLKFNAETAKMWAEVNRHAVEYALTDKKLKWYEVTILLAIIAAAITVTKLWL